MGRSIRELLRVGKEGEWRNFTYEELKTFYDYFDVYSKPGPVNPTPIQNAYRYLSKESMKEAESRGNSADDSGDMSVDAAHGVLKEKIAEVIEKKGPRSTMLSHVEWRVV